jgi:hypothetical protein
MAESGAPIYPSESKSVLRYQRKSTVGRNAHMDASLYDKAVTAPSALTPLLSGASSQVLGGIVGHSSPKLGGGVVGKSPPSSFLWRGVLIPSAPSLLSGCASPIAENGVNFRSDGLTQSQKWPVGFGLSGEIVVWDQGDEVWVGEGGDSPYPLGVCPPYMPLIGCWMVLKMKIRPSRF